MRDLCSDFLCAALPLDILSIFESLLPLATDIVLYIVLGRPGLLGAGILIGGGGEQLLDAELGSVSAVGGGKAGGLDAANVGGCEEEPSIPLVPVPSCKKAPMSPLLLTSVGSECVDRDLRAICFCCKCVNVNARGFGRRSVAGCFGGDETSNFGARVSMNLCTEEVCLWVGGNTSFGVSGRGLFGAAVGVRSFGDDVFGLPISCQEFG